MPLGDQFKNTFHEGPDGKPIFHTDPGSLPEVQHMWKTDPKWAISDSNFNRTRPRVTEEPHTGVAYQGMLFDPHTATGSRQDPLVPRASRVDAFKTALNLHNIDSYITRARGELGKSYKPTEKKAQEGADLIANTAADKTNIPFHLIKSIQANAVLYPGTKASDGGHFSPTSRNLVLHEQKPFPKITREPDIEVPKGEKGAPIPNKNFNSLTNRHWGSERIWQNDMAQHGTITDHEGKEVPYEEDVTELDNLTREGHTMNIYPGAGKSTAKYIATPFKVESGWRARGRYGGEETHTTFHTRHERIPTEGTEIIPGKKTKIYGPSYTSPSTIVHEIGHALDPNVSSSFEDPHHRQDTVQEATADGYRDRFGQENDVYESALQPSPERAQQMRTDGYSTRHSVVGRNDFNKALYASVRQHVSVGDTHVKDIASRSALFEEATGKQSASTKQAYSRYQPAENRSLANTLLLGHLYHHHEHVRGILDHLGLTDEGKKAASVYRRNITDAGVNHDWEQETLF